MMDALRICDKVSLFNKHFELSDIEVNDQISIVRECLHANVDAKVNIEPIIAFVVSLTLRQTNDVQQLVKHIKSIIKKKYLPRNKLRKIQDVLRNTIDRSYREFFLRDAVMQSWLAMIQTEYLASYNSLMAGEKVEAVMEDVQLERSTKTFLLSVPGYPDWIQGLRTDVDQIVHPYLVQRNTIKVKRRTRRLPGKLAAYKRRKTVAYRMEMERLPTSRLDLDEMMKDKILTPEQQASLREGFEYIQSSATEDHPIYIYVMMHGNLYTPMGKSKSSKDPRFLLNTKESIYHFDGQPQEAFPNLREVHIVVPGQVGCPISASASTISENSRPLYPQRLMEKMHAHGNKVDEHVFLREVKEGLAQDRNSGAYISETNVQALKDGTLKNDHSKMRIGLTRSYGSDTKTKPFYREYVDKLLFDLDHYVQLQSYNVHHPEQSTIIQKKWSKVKFWDVGGYGITVLYAEGGLLKDNIGKNLHLTRHDSDYTSIRLALFKELEQHDMVTTNDLINMLTRYGYNKIYIADGSCYSAGDTEINTHPGYKHFVRSHHRLGPNQHVFQQIIERPNWWHSNKPANFNTFSNSSHDSNKNNLGSNTNYSDSNQEESNQEESNNEHFGSFSRGASLRKSKRSSQTQSQKNARQTYTSKHTRPNSKKK